MDRQGEGEFWRKGKGLPFTCSRCSLCCRGESGFVFLSEGDLDALARSQGLPRDEFAAVYCRWVDGEDGREVLSLKEKANFDCILWNSGCSVYGARPLQCRAYPFWPRNVETPEAWSLTAEECPGINGGEYHSPEEIAGWLDAQAKEAPLPRPRGGRMGQ